MICDKCGKKEATFHSRTNINGDISEIHLCDECAKKTGAYSKSMRDFNNFFSDDPLISLDFDEDNNDVCDVCGTTFEDFKNCGLLGCDHCYDVFSSRLKDIIENVQGSNYHVGKTALDHKELTYDEKIEDLREQINRAVDKEDYETAAKIKKQIEKLQGEHNGK